MLTYNQEETGMMKILSMKCDACQKAYTTSEDMEKFEHMYLGTMEISGVNGVIILDICDECTRRMLKEHLSL